MTSKEEADAKLLNERSTAHLIDNYLSGTPCSSLYLENIRCQRENASAIV